MTTDAMPTSLTITTAASSGAVALLQLHGSGAVALLEELTGRNDWQAGRLRYVAMATIDHGLAVVWRDGQRGWVQLMPHGGKRVVQRLTQWLTQRGCVVRDMPDPAELYPEAATIIEAEMLATMARAASPAAIDLLAMQPQRWQTFDVLPEEKQRQQWPRIIERSTLLDRLIDPPMVVVAGRPNVGKSTLLNRLAGKAVSIVADLPGTTRDWVGSLVELNSNTQTDVTSASNATHIAVRWLDTPGLRSSDDPVEEQAIELARAVLAQADVLIAMRDPEHDWPAAEALPRQPDVWVMNKADQAGDAKRTMIDLNSDNNGHDAEHPLPISALHDQGIDHLHTAVIAKLGLSDLHDDLPWAFTARLRARAQRIDTSV